MAEKKDFRLTKAEVRAVAEAYAYGSDDDNYVGGNRYTSEELLIGLRRADSELAVKLEALVAMLEDMRSFCRLRLEKR